MSSTEDGKQVPWWYRDPSSFGPIHPREFEEVLKQADEVSGGRASAADPSAVAEAIVKEYFLK